MTTPLKKSTDTSRAELRELTEAGGWLTFAGRCIVGSLNLQPVLHHSRLGRSIFAQRLP